MAVWGAMRAVPSGPCPGSWLWLWLLLTAVLAAGGGSEHPRLSEAVLRDLARGKVEVSASGGCGPCRDQAVPAGCLMGCPLPPDLRRVTAESPQGGTYRGRAGAGSRGFLMLSRARPAALRR